MLRLAVAASGGADSTALIAHAARVMSPSEVVVLSVDHCTRTAAAAERGQAAALAARFGFTFAELLTGATASHQGAWREARLAALLRYCQNSGIPRLWLGHHRDDSVETAALRLLAGGNLGSLAGISAVRLADGISIERPLLCHSARVLRRELMTMGFAWFEDPSNQDSRYRRVAVRRLLAAAPIGVPADLVKRTGGWRERREALVYEAWKLAVQAKENGALLLNPAVMRRLPPALAASLLRCAAVAVAGREQRLRNVDFFGALVAGEAQSPTIGGLASQMSAAPPWQLGGVRVWSVAEGWLIGRDYRHIQDVAPLVAGQVVDWDARYQVRASTALPPGEWRVGRVGLHAARRVKLAPSDEWAAAALGIWCGSDLIAAPDLGVWRGKSGLALRQTLDWRRLPSPCNGVFRLAPPTEAPILRPWQQIFGYGPCADQRPQR